MMATIKCSPRRRSRSYTASSASDEQETKFSTDITHYKLGELIGYGSSAVVHAGTYLPLNKVVAIKVFDLDSFERDHIDELRKEIQIMSLSRHPNLLRVYGSLVHEFKLYIFMPFMAGGSCLDIMRTAHPHGFDEPIIGAILLQGLEGLSYLHKNGLMHRDVKAGNLLVGEDGVVQLADFGVSSSLMEGGERKGLRKTFAGTPCWMAPEVIEQSGYGFKADIWSLGITALELANGRAPFSKYPPMKVLMLTLKRSPPTLDRSTTRHKFTKTFKDMIDSCLSKDPEKRPTPEKLLQHSFFKQAAKRGISLVNTLLRGLPAITARGHRYKPPSLKKDSPESIFWDFDHTADGDRSEEECLKVSNGDVPVTSPPKDNAPNPPCGSEELPQTQSSLKKSRFVIDMNGSTSTQHYSFRPPFPLPCPRASFSHSNQRLSPPGQALHAPPSSYTNATLDSVKQHAIEERAPDAGNDAQSESQLPATYELRKGRFCVNSNTQTLHSPARSSQYDRLNQVSLKKRLAGDACSSDTSLRALYAQKNDAADASNHKPAIDSSTAVATPCTNDPTQVAPLPSFPHSDFSPTNGKPKPVSETSQNNFQTTGQNSSWCAEMIDRRGRFEVCKPPPYGQKNAGHTSQPFPVSNPLIPMDRLDLVDLSKKVASSTSFLCEKIQNLTSENSELVSLSLHLITSLQKLGKSNDDIKSSTPQLLHPLLDRILSSAEPSLQNNPSL